MLAVALNFLIWFPSDNHQAVQIRAKLSWRLKADIKSQCQVWMAPRSGSLPPVQTLIKVFWVS